MILWTHLHEEFLNNLDISYIDHRSDSPGSIGVCGADSALTVSNIKGGDLFMYAFADSVENCFSMEPALELELKKKEKASVGRGTSTAPQGNRDNKNGYGGRKEKTIEPDDEANVKCLLQP